MDIYIFKFFLFWFMLLYYGEAKLSRPRGVKTIVLSSTSISVHWNFPLNQINIKNLLYKVRYAKLSKHNTYKTRYTRKHRIIIDKLHPNRTYEFSVRAQEGRSQGRVSSWSTTALNKTLKIVPGTVSRLKAFPITSQSIKLTWKLPPQRNRTTGFFVLWSEMNKDLSEHRVAVSKQSNSSIFLDLTPYRMYSFRVVTLKANGVEKSTGKIFARPYEDRPGQAPRNVTFSLLSDSVLHVKWLPPPVRKRHGIIQTYKLQYRRKGARRGDICTVTLLEKPRKYNLTELQKGETYKLRIAARTVNGTGPYSKWTSIDIPQKWKGKRRKSVQKYEPSIITNTIPVPTTSTSKPPNDDYPEMPEGLKAIALSSTRIKLSWDTPSSPSCCPIVAFTIHVTNIDNLEDEREIVTGPNTEAVIVDLDPSTYYGFNVTAFNTHGVSHNSEEIIQKTKEPVPPRILDIHHTDAIEGGIVNLTCRAAGDPLPWVSWHSTNYTTFKQIHTEVKSFVNRHPEKGTNEMIVMFQDISTRQAGEYMCVAKNIAGKVNSSLDLQVKVPVRFTKVEGGTAMIDTSVNLTCGASGIPLPTLTWLTPKNQLANINSRATIYEWIETEPEYKHVGTMYVIFQTLQLNKTEMADSGNYTCLAQNDVTFSRRKVELQIHVPPPSPVKNLRAVSVSPSVVQVSWEKPDYNYTITSYKVIYRRKESGIEQSLNTIEQSCHINDLSPNRMYKIKVLAINKRYGEPSRVEIRTLPNHSLQPANVSAVALNSSIIRLNWEAPDNIDRAYIKGYNIYYRKENGSEEEKLFTEGNRNKQFLIGLGKEEIYFLRISTLMTWGDEAPSQWIKIKKSAQELLPPPEPSNVLVTPASEKVRITWKSPTGKGLKKLKGYRIVYGPKDDTSAKIKKIRVAKFATRHTISSLRPGTAYIISLRSFNDYGESAPIYIRTTTKATRPGPVQSASATSLSSTTIFVSWLTPTKGQATDYHVRYWRPYKHNKQSQWLKAPQTNLTVKDLRKFREYKFEIIPYDAGEIGESTVLFARTKSDVPDGSPRSIRIKAINATAVLIRWGSPPKALENGRITGYKLVFKRITSSKPLAIFTVDGNRNNYTFYGLEPSMEYKARIAAMTIRGTGPYSKWFTEKTLQVDKLPPERPLNLTLKSTYKTIVISWRKPRDTGATVDGYILGYGRYIPEVNRQILTADKLTFVIKKLRKNTEYIISVRAFNKYGESAATYDFIKTKDIPIQLEPPKMIKALTLSTTSIGIYWIDPVLKLNKFKRRNKRMYTLRYSSELETEYTYLNVTKPPVILKELDVDTQYEFAIRVVRNNDFSRWSLPESNTTFMKPPVHYPMDLTVTATDIPSTVIVTWKPVKDPNRKTDKSVLYYTTNPTQDALWIKHELKSGKKSITIADLEATTNYYFKIQSGNAGGLGPFSPIVVFRSFTVDEGSVPTHVRIKPVNINMATTVDMSWEAPVNTMGTIIGYLVSYTSTPDEEDSWVTQSERGQSTIVFGLQYNSIYYFKIQARYAANILGPMSAVALYRTPKTELSTYRYHLNEVTVTTTHIPETDNSTIETVTYPQTPYVKFNLTSLTKTPLPGVNITWSVSEQDSDLTGYVISYTEYNKTVWKSEEFRQPPININGLEFDTVYYVKIQPKFNNTLGPVVQEISFKTQVKDLMVSPGNVTVNKNNSNPTSVEVMWMAPGKPSGTITGYRVLYSEDKLIMKDSYSLNVQNTSVYINNIKINTTYYITVQPVYLYNFPGVFSRVFSFSTIIEDKLITSTAQPSFYLNTEIPTTLASPYNKTTLFVTMSQETTTPFVTEATTNAPVVPINPPLHMILISTNSTITVTWTQPEDNDHIAAYRIKYWSTSNNEIILVDKDEATELSVILFNLEPSTVYTIDLSSLGSTGVSKSVVENISTRATTE